MLRDLFYNVKKFLKYRYPVVYQIIVKLKYYIKNHFVHILFYPFFTFFSIFIYTFKLNIRFGYIKTSRIGHLSFDVDARINQLIYI